MYAIDDNVHLVLYIVAIIFGSIDTYVETLYLKYLYPF